ncbi:MAG: hypothetical protein ACP5XB_19220 [Isosphaeraceae bacterium]
MDQLKEFLRQCIKYRFWIAVGAAALFSIIAYFLGSRPVQDATTKETSKIETAYKGVKQYTTPGIPNDQYKPLVEEKTQILSKDVITAWKELYGRQAPLLNWPSIVEARFHKWGPHWPEDVDPGSVQVAIVDYFSGAYQDYVDKVYKSFRPFDPETGEGIVSAPPKETLLKPVTVDIAKPPDLGVVWAAQQRLWIQRTVLDVVAKVNTNAKNWDSAIIRQINLLEVGNSVAQDQRSIAKGDTLKEAEPIVAPGTEQPATDSGGDAAGPGGMMSMMSMMGGANSNSNPETVSYVPPPNDKDQYKILPFLLSVLIDQDRIQDLLVGLENSPMSIQVMEFDLQRPSSKVTKPEKGMGINFSGYTSSMMGMMMGMRGMSGFGGSASGFTDMMSAGYASMMAANMGRMGSMSMGSMMGSMGGGADTKKGVDKRSTDRRKTREEELKKVEATKGVSHVDPYYNIVEVKVYGQARFYNPPKDTEAAAEESPGQVTAETPQAGAGAQAKTAEPAKAQEPAKTAAPKTEPAKAQEPAKTTPAKAQEPAKTTPAKAQEPAKTAAPKIEATKK